MQTLPTSQYVRIWSSISGNCGNKMRRNAFLVSQLLQLFVLFVCFNLCSRCSSQDIKVNCRRSRRIMSPIPPLKIRTPQPPYGCSQLNRLSARDAFTCFSEAQMSRLRNRPTSPDAGVSVAQVITNHGYPVETHSVTTKDGYILTMFRIPRGKSAKASKGPVLVQHGLLASSAQWVVNVPDKKSLAFLLADSGYDVWLGNIRGSKYSQGHTSLSTDNAQYWEFSWHEMGQYDVPASIDYILTNYTDKRLFYIGHSMGTTMFFTAMSKNPSYNDKIKVAYLMAPVAHLGNSTNIAHLAGLPSYFSQSFFRGVNWASILPERWAGAIQNRFYPMCESSALLCTLCLNSVFAFFGFDYGQIDFNQLPVILSHFPDYSSTRSAIHYAQSMVTGEFREFDYGPSENPNHYNGSCFPPKYRMSNVKAKVMTFWSWNDNFATPGDAAKTRGQLPNVIEDVEIPHCAFNHVDFAIAKDADKWVYKKILKSMDAFSS